MKKLFMVVTMALATTLVAQDKAMSLADARGQIGSVVSDPAKMTQVIRQLSAADQKSFLADVNEAISKLPGSNEERAAKFVDANTAALKGAKKGNLIDLLAEVYATVPPEALTVVNESLATGTFNRAADPSRTFTDEQFTTIATNTMAKIQERNASADDSDVRNVFAALMFIRASNGTPADLTDKLVAGLPSASTREIARSEWIPSALGLNGAKTYDPMLGVSDAGEAPDVQAVSLMLTPQVYDALLADLASAVIGTAGAGQLTLTGAMLDTSIQALPRFGEDFGIDRIPRTLNTESPVYPGSGGEEPRGYRGQTIHYRR